MSLRYTSHCRVDADLPQRSVVHAPFTASDSNVVDTPRPLDPLPPSHHPDPSLLVSSRTRIPPCPYLNNPTTDPYYSRSTASPAGPSPTPPPPNSLDLHVSPCAYGLLCHQDSRYAMDVDKRHAVGRCTILGPSWCCRWMVDCRWVQCLE